MSLKNSSRVTEEEERGWLASRSQMWFVNAKLCRLSRGIRDIVFVSAGDMNKPLTEDIEKAAPSPDSCGERLDF